MKEYKKPMLIIDEINIDEILAISVNDGMFNMGMKDESGLEVGGFDELW